MTWFSGATYNPVAHSFTAFIGLFHKMQSYRIHAQADPSTATLTFHDPLSYPASTCKDPNLPGYMDALTVAE